MTSSQTEPAPLDVAGQVLRVRDHGPASSDRRDGDGPSVVVYVHGAGGFANVPLVEQLAGSYRVVTVELPGVGRTRAGSATSMRELGQLLAGAITNLDVEGCAVVVETVMARAALWLAVDAPDRLARLVLLSPTVVLGPGKRVPTVPPVLLVKSRQSHSAPVDFTVGTAQEERFLGRAFGPARDEELQQALPNVSVSTLVVRGTEDFLDPGEEDPSIVTALQHGHRILIYDAGPAVAYERPEAVQVLLDDFFRYGEKFLYDHTSTAIAS